MNPFLHSLPSRFHKLRGLFDQSVPVNLVKEEVVSVVYIEARRMHHEVNTIVVSFRIQMLL